MDWAILSIYPSLVFVDAGGIVGEWTTERLVLQAVSKQNLFLALETQRTLGLGGR